MRKIDLTNFQVATSETARDINRRIVLNLIRRHQPLSRADLARRSGLQRSTVSAITEELITTRWVTEGELGNLPLGRKPTFLHLNGRRAGVLGVDIRPERTTIGLAGLDSHILARESLPTGNDPARFLPELGRRLRKLMAAHPHIPCEGVGVALPGRVDLGTQRLAFAPNLGWSDVDLKTPLEAATGLPVELENAANACALAELWSGRHGESVRHLVAVTVSEGIGVGMMINGQLVHGARGMAGEFGHVTLQEDGPLCRCGKRGCWEVCASNRAAIRYYLEAHSQPEPAAPPTFEEVMRLASAGDPPAVAAIERMAHYLGIGLAMLASGLAPEVIVLIGELTAAWDRVRPIIVKAVQSRQSTHSATAILPTDPATDPRLGGTIALVLQKHFGAPRTA